MALCSICASIISKLQKRVYGFVAGDDVLRFAAMMVGEVVDEIGTTGDFIGHGGRR